MSESNHILKNLKKQGYKFTKVRKLILDLLIKSSKPLSSKDIKKDFLAKKNMTNKTTIYRELAFLKSKGVIRELQLGDNTMRYEIMPDNHHHHIVCLNCEKIEDVVLENDLVKQEEMITKKKEFKILYHSLEFYGLCFRCKNVKSLKFLK